MTIRIPAACLLVSLLLAASRGLSQEPARGSAGETTSPSGTTDEPVVGQLEHAGWGLVGSGGRHYVFGGLAIADYMLSGQRHIVTLQQEEPSLLPRPDENYLYYRELGSGRRWAIGRYPQADETYVVYFQPQRAPPAAEQASEAAKPKWTLFHRARLIWPEQDGESAGIDPQISQMTPMTKARCLGVP